MPEWNPKHIFLFACEQVFNGKNKIKYCVMHPVYSPVLSSGGGGGGESFCLTLQSLEIVVSARSSRQIFPYRVLTLFCPPCTCMRINADFSHSTCSVFCVCLCVHVCACVRLFMCVWWLSDFRYRLESIAGLSPV